MCGQASPAEPEPTADERAEHLRLVIEREYASLYRRVGVLVYRICGRLRREEADRRIEEVVGDVVGRALQSAATFDPSRSALAWLTGFALNILREKRRYQTRHAVLETDLSGEAWKNALEGLCAAAETETTTIRLDIQQALGRMDDAQRRVLQLRFFDGLDGDELAKAVGAPSSGAARVRLTRALQSLRKQFGTAEGEKMP
jgi:RNA polymerase sigma factor (sigma-70 family)